VVFHHHHRRSSSQEAQTIKKFPPHDSRPVIFREGNQATKEERATGQWERSRSSVKGSGFLFPSLLFS
jgi:hypothetical protein